MTGPRSTTSCPCARKNSNNVFLSSNPAWSLAKYTFTPQLYHWAPALFTCLSSVCAYPISLSYHASTLTKLPPPTRVISRSAILACGLPIISEETSGSSLTVNIPCQRGLAAAARKMSLTSSLLVFFLVTKVRSTYEPATVGTRTEIPSQNDTPVTALVTVVAAPVEDGTMFCAAARPSRRSFLLGLSTKDWLSGELCM